MSQLLSPGLANSEYIEGLGFAPITLTDFSYQSGLWIPVYNDPTVGNIAINAPNYEAAFSMPGPNPNLGVNEQYQVGMKSRFRIFPDITTGHIKIRIRLTGATFENFPSNNGNAWFAGMMIEEFFYSSGTAWLGIGAIARSDFSLSRSYGGQFRCGVTGNYAAGNRYTAEYLESADGQYLDNTIDLGFDSGYTVEQFDALDNIINVNGGGDNSINFAGIYYLGGLNINKGIQPFLILCANCIHQVSIKISQFEVIEGILGWGI